jgi:2'-5' RNA ligase
MYTHKYQQQVRPKHGLFFAIMVPAADAGTISRLFQDLRIRYGIQKNQIPENRMHVSLLPVLAADDLPEQIIQISLLVGNAVRFVEFDLTLNRVLSFRNGQDDKPLVLAADIGFAHTTNLLANHIRHTFSMISGRPTFRAGHISPHVTLAWARQCVPEQLVPPIALPVQEVALIHSHIGKSRYDILGRWPLVPR